MKRIFLIGNSPLPHENVKIRPAAGLRTHQFLKTLEGCEVEKFLIAMSGDGGIAKDDPELMKIAQKRIDDFEPDAVVSVNTYPSFVASGLDFRAPLWADLNGWIMGEAQAQAFKSDSNDYLSHYWAMEQKTLLEADKISTVSEAQAHAVYGELAGLGRLNAETFGYKFVEPIANGVEWFENDRAMSKVEFDVPDGSFILLWMGGYNTWVDEMNLFKGIEDAMERCDRLYFVSTGGGIDGLDNETFARFKAMVDKSEYSERFKFLGWVDTEHIPYIYSRAHCGLNVDRKCAETTFGARNRINEMMKFGLPVITTLGSEISYEVVRSGAGRGVKSGDHEELTEAVVAMYKSSQGYGEKGRLYAEQECSYRRVMRPFKKWLENPRPAPDRGVSVRMSGGVGAKGALKYLRENGVKKAAKKFVQKFK